MNGAYIPTTWIATPHCTGGGDAVNAPGVWIVWQSTDYNGKPPQPIATAQIPNRTHFACPGNDIKTNAGGVSTTNLANDTEINASGGATTISISDKITIGIGLGVGVPSLLLAMWTGWYTRRQYLSRKQKRERSIPEVATAEAERNAPKAGGEDQETPGRDLLVQKPQP